MIAIEKNEQGAERFLVDVELANDTDLVRAEAGNIAPEQVRRLRVRAIVGSRATRLVISESMARQLGLEISGTTKARYPDGRTAERPMARGLHLTYAGRDGVYNAVVEPSRESVLIGMIVMEDLDLIVDGVTRRLSPRDPKQITSEA